MEELEDGGGIIVARPVSPRAEGGVDLAIRLPVGVRNALSVPIRSIPFPILGGANRGRLWSLAALGRGVLTGRYERERFALLQALVSRGDHVWDVGAHRGYAALILARAVGPNGSVVAFEPASVNRWYLERHVAWNRMSHARILSCALGSTDGESTIGGAGSSVSFTVGAGTEAIQLRAASSLVADGLQPPTFAKIDVEGWEGAVLKGARGVLGPQTLALISIHSAGAYAECTELLRRDEFSVYISRPLRANLRASSPRWRGDPDLIAVGRGRTVPQETLDRFGFTIARGEGETSGLPGARFSGGTP